MEEKGNSDLSKFRQQFETVFKVLTTLVNAKSFIMCGIMLYLHSGWCRLIVGFAVNLMYLMKKYRKNFGMVSRCVASRDEKKKCNKQQEIGSKVEFDGVDEFASGLVDQLGGINLFNFSTSESCRVKWQQEASNCVLSFQIFV